MSRTSSDPPAHYFNDSTYQPLIYQTKEPVSWRKGAQYQQPYGDLNDHLGFRIVPRPLLTKAQATQILFNFLTPLENASKTQKEALNRLNTAAHHPAWDPSLVIKALPDLDVAFFDGRLKGNVVAVWATEGEIVEAVRDVQKPVESFSVWHSRRRMKGSSSAKRG